MFGLLILAVVELVPILGVIVKIVVLILGLGGIVLYLARHHKARRAAAKTHA